MIAIKSKFYSGLIMMALFTVVLVAIFMPLFNGKNGLEYLDNLYNSISRDPPIISMPWARRSAPWIRKI